MGKQLQWVSGPNVDPTKHYWSVSKANKKLSYSVSPNKMVWTSPGLPVVATVITEDDEVVVERRFKRPFSSLDEARAWCQAHFEGL
jgi:hypothetical protein